MKKFAFWGTVLGLIGGLWVTESVAGLLVGAVVGALHDVWFLNIYRRQVIEDLWDQEFTQSVVAVAARVAKADGQVSRTEISVFKKSFCIPVNDEPIIGLLFDTYRNKEGAFEYHAVKLSELCAKRNLIARQVMDALIDMASQDGGIQKSQSVMLGYLGGLLNIPNDELMATLCKYASVGAGFNKKESSNKSYHGNESKTTVNDDDDPYRILGVDRNMPLKEIKKHYRKLVRENHPDKLQAAGKSKKAILYAEEKLAQYNDAFALIESQLT